jgi:hypothetical protein
MKDFSGMLKNFGETGHELKDFDDFKKVCCSDV